MIWGEVINCVRTLHLDLMNEFAVDSRLFSKDLELKAASIPFPEAIDDFDEWLEPILPESLQDVIPLHPVERALIEGPLLPIQKVSFNTKSDVDALFAAIIACEKEWCEKNGVSTPAKMQFIENYFVVQALKISVRAGFGKITALKGN